MKKPEVLLAKGPQNQGKQDPSETLVGHTRFVFEAAEVMREIFKKIFSIEDPRKKRAKKEGITDLLSKALSPSARRQGR